MYHNGASGPPDYVRAHMWFNLGAVKGDAEALIDLALIRVTGLKGADKVVHGEKGGLNFLYIDLHFGRSNFAKFD